MMRWYRFWRLFFYRWLDTALKLVSRRLQVMLCVSCQLSSDNFQLSSGTGSIATDLIKTITSVWRLNPKWAALNEFKLLQQKLVPVRCFNELALTIDMTIGSDALGMFVNFANCLWQMLNVKQVATVWKFSLDWRHSHEINMLKAVLFDWVLEGWLCVSWAVTEGNEILCKWFSFIKWCLGHYGSFSSNFENYSFIDDWCSYLLIVHSRWIQVHLEFGW